MNSSTIEVSAHARTLPGFVDRVGDLMPGLCRAMVRHEQNYVTRGELTLPQFWTLEILRQQGARTMHELIAELQLKSSTATMFIDRLARLRLVRRERDRVDRRVVHVLITAKGRRIVDESHRQKRRSMLRLFKPLTPVERSNYLALMGKLVSELAAEEGTHG